MTTTTKPIPADWKPVGYLPADCHDDDHPVARIDTIGPVKTIHEQYTYCPKCEPHWQHARSNADGILIQPR